MIIGEDLVNLADVLSKMAHGENMEVVFKVTKGQLKKINEHYYFVMNGPSADKEKIPEASEVRVQARGIVFIYKEETDAVG